MQAPTNSSDRPLDGQAKKMANDAQSDDDWEYEYHDNETEEFYVTLDLTSYAPPLARKRKHGPSNSPNPTPQEGEDPAVAPATAQPSQPQTPQSTDDIQILDFHSENPIVSFEGKFYTCNWASALGTDLLFSARSDPPNPPVRPSETSTPPQDTSTSATTINPHSTPNYTLQALTPLRLLAHPCLPAPRTTPAASTPKPSSSSKPAQQQDQRTTAYVAPHRRAQTAFLAHLAAAKQARGDTDAVPVYTNEPNHQAPAVPAMVGGGGQGRRRRAAGRARKRLRAGARAGAAAEAEAEESEDESDGEGEEDDDAGGGAVEAQPWGGGNRLRRERRWSRRFREALLQEAADVDDDENGEDNDKNDEDDADEYRAVDAGDEGEAAALDGASTTSLDASGAGNAPLGDGGETESI